jgi:hypothetical protein
VRKRIKRRSYRDLCVVGQNTYHLPSDAQVVKSTHGSMSSGATFQDLPKTSYSYAMVHTEMTAAVRVHDDLCRYSLLFSQVFSDEANSGPRG